MLTGFMASLYFFLVALVCAVVTCNLAYLLLLLIAAQAAKSAKAAEEVREGDVNGTLPRLCVVIPAHNEELVLAATLSSLDKQAYPKDLFRVVVVADNCTDQTAAIARRYNVAVLERINPDLRGKGYALEYAFSHLLAMDGTDATPSADGFVILDADTWAAPDFLSQMARRVWRDCGGGGGYRSKPVALQGRYGVLNQNEGWRAALMAGAFDLFNHVKPLGQDRLGLSVGLKGNGMAFTRPVAEQARWRGHSITEDIDYGLDLLQHHGVSVGYVPDARVRAQMPTTAEQAASQRTRWEAGRYRLMRERALPLLAGGVRRRDARLLDAACNLLSLPLSELVILLGAGTLLILGGVYGSVLRAGWLAVAAALWIGLSVYIVGGLRIADAPRLVYLSLLRAPLYAVWKLALYLPGLLRRRRASAATSDSVSGASGSEWVRTARSAIAVESVTAGTPAATDAEPVRVAKR